MNQFVRRTQIKTVRVSLAACLFFSASGAVRAGEPSGAAFLKISPSVRNHALGGSHPALSFGSQAIGSNPGNLVLQRTPFEVTSTFATMIGDSTYGHLAGAMRSGNRAWGLHATFLQSGTLEGRDAFGAKTADFTSQDLSMGVSHALKLSRRVRTGATIKAVRQSIGDETSNTAFALDAGASLATTHALFGVSIQNLGSKIEFGKEGDNLPANYAAGVAVETGNITTVLGLGHWVNEGETYVNFGLEYRMNPIALRVGYRNETGENLALKAQDTGEQLLGGLTGGIGFSRGNWTLDYAVAQTAVEYGMSHRVAMSWSFGLGSGQTSVSGLRGRQGNRWVK